MEKPFEQVRTWLLTSGLFVNDEKNPNSGGVYSYFDEEKNEFSFLYPEITGYFLSTLSFLYKIEKNENLIKYAKLSADWLIKIYDRYGAIIQGISTNKEQQNYAYSFDTAICIKGLLDVYKISKNKKYLDYSKKMITFLQESLDGDGTLKPFKNLHKNKFETNKKLWYKNKGCLHIKTSMAFFQLYEITNDKNLLESALKISDTFSKYQDSDGGIHLHQNNPVINLHTQCYAIEGLLYAYFVTDEKKYLQSCKNAANWSLKKINNDGSIDLWFNSKHKSRAVYPVSQLIRILILLDKINKNSKNLESIQKLNSFLISFQAKNSANIINGGFYEELYKSVFGWKKRLRLNSWTSMFALQAINWFDHYDKIEFKDSITYLY